MSDGLTIEATSVVSAVDGRQIADLVERAASVDKVGPIDDQVRSELAHGAGPDATHLLGRVARDAVVAYAHATRDSDGTSAHLVVDPERRRRGHGHAFVQALLDRVSAGQSLRIWAHGDTAGAQALASACSFERVRDLLQMRRSLAEPLPDAAYPDDVTVRSFVPDQDDAAWVALNARAFASHPEQGRLTVADLHNRMGEGWFDAAGFFVAERDGLLVGSHWTKVHPASESAESREVGEVYAVGVAPDAQGLGLGKALTLTGLQHLRDRGLDEVMLYVDGDNRAAVALYERLGFSTTAVDVMYARSQ